MFVSYSSIVISADTQNINIESTQAISKLGKPLLAKPLDPLTHQSQINQYYDALNRFQNSPKDPENIIWLGRRIAYLGDYQKAIQIYSEGIANFPNDARLYRHRGHRYISVREFKLAIKDFEIAVQLIEGKPDSIEPDGIPNEKNIPISSLHTNIWYHLGLAYYLDNDLDNASRSFIACINASNNDDNLVSASHWAYMISRKQGNVKHAKKLLENINEDMNIIENFGYHRLLLFYKNKLSEEQLLASDNPASGASEAILYGLGNWYFYNGFASMAESIFQRTVNKGNWASFGSIAAEVALARNTITKN